MVLYWRGCQWQTWSLILHHFILQCCSVYCLDLIPQRLLTILFTSYMISRAWFQYLSLSLDYSLLKIPVTLLLAVTNPSYIPYQNSWSCYLLSGTWFSKHMSESLNCFCIQSWCCTDHRSSESFQMFLICMVDNPWHFLFVVLDFSVSVSGSWCYTSKLYYFEGCC